MARTRLFLVTKVAGAVILACLTGSAFAQTNITAITACGTKISVTGSYAASGTLSTSSGDCIDISAPKVFLDLGSATLSGSGSAASAVHILKTATGAFVKRGEIKGTWSTGVEDDANGSVVFDVDMVGATVDTAVFVNGAHGATVSGVNTFIVTSYRLHLKSAVSCVIENNDVSAGGNVYGIWVEASKNNLLIDNDESGSPGVGEYLGCAPTGGPMNAKCKPNPGASTGNTLLDEDASGAANGGIVIDLGDLKNRIFGSDGSSLIDENVCGKNVWQGNSFTTTNEACIN